MLGTSADNLHSVVDEVLQKLRQRKNLRLLVNNCKVDDTIRTLKRGVLVELV